MKQEVGVGFGVMLLKNNKILLGLRHEDPEKADSDLHGEGTWSMPGGSIKFGEDFEEACYREVMEETNVKINKEKLKLISIANDRVVDAQFVTIGFLCTDFKRSAKLMEPDEFREWRWFDLDNLPQNMFFCSRNILNNYLDRKIYQKKLELVRSKYSPK